MMKIDYNLAKEMRDLGYEAFQDCPVWNDNLYLKKPTEEHYRESWNHCLNAFEPKLEKLIEQCGDNFVSILKLREGKGFRAQGNDYPDNYPDWGYSIHGKTALEAVARLWVELNKKT
jgi:hypothetical protein